MTDTATKKTLLVTLTIQIPLSAIGALAATVMTTHGEGREGAVRDVAILSGQSPESIQSAIGALVLSATPAAKTLDALLLQAGLNQYQKDAGEYLTYCLGLRRTREARS